MNIFIKIELHVIMYRYVLKNFGNIFKLLFWIKQNNLSFFNSLMLLIGKLSYKETLVQGNTERRRLGNTCYQYKEKNYIIISTNEYRCHSILISNLYIFTKIQLNLPNFLKLFLRKLSSARAPNTVFINLNFVDWDSVSYEVRNKIVFY